MAGRVRVAIESIAAGGDGVGRVDGLVIFLPRTAPGDVVEAVVRSRGRLGRGEVHALVERSPSRVAPHCPHYEGDDCGGCQLQHLAYPAQLDQKRRIVADAFQRIARRDVDVPPVVASPSPWEYRSRLTLALQRRAGRWVLGLHSRRSPGVIFNLAQCPITDPRVVGAWREVAGAAPHLPDAPALRGTVRLLGAGLGLVLEGGDAWPGARAFAARCPSLSVIRWIRSTGEARVVLDRRPGGEAAPEISFDQVNHEVASLARADLVERAMAREPATVVDAYAGLGATAGLLAARGAVVTAIEADAEAAAHCARRFPGVRVLGGTVENLLERSLPADVVILNPPRAGVDRRVTAILEAATPRPRALLYMSCDPATLARDVAALPSWRVAAVRVWDMFPQTAHVEVTCELIPEGA